MHRQPPAAEGDEQQPCALRQHRPNNLAAPCEEKSSDTPSPMNAYMGRVDRYCRLAARTLASL